MRFDITPMQESDIPAFARMEVAASANWPFALVMEVPGKDRHVFVEEWARKSMREDTNVYWMKATDTDTGELVSVAVWRIPVSAGVGEREGKEDVVDAENTQRSEAQVVTAAEKEEGDGNTELFAVLGKMWKDFEEEFIGRQPYARKPLS